MTESYIPFIQNTLNLSDSDFQFKKLFGQASSRQYFRITLPIEPQQPSSVILMVLPGGFTSPAEEITKTAPQAPKEYPFLNIQKYLHQLELYVPQIYGYDAQQGLILLQDLGDQSFEELVKNADGGFKLVYYKKLIDELIHLQVKTTLQPGKHCLYHYKNFDQSLLDWEFYHFLEYGIEDRFKVSVPEPQKNTFKELTQKMSHAITQMPQGFVHRDFQSRNVMFHEFQFYLIDFQDALTGPLLYDLVALLRDSYIDISAKELQVLISHYAQSLPPEHPYADKTDQIFSDFHLIALHRKLKDTGRFQYIDTVRGNPNFLEHVPQSLEYIKTSFDYFRDNPKAASQLNLETGHFTQLFQIIQPYIKEWA